MVDRIWVQVISAAHSEWIFPFTRLRLIATSEGVDPDAVICRSPSRLACRSTGWSWTSTRRSCSATPRRNQRPALGRRPSATTRCCASWTGTSTSACDQTLWRLFYETADRAEEILALDVSDLDLASKRARVVSKGGNTEWVLWQTGAAMLLPRLLAGRTRGPVFLADRKPPRSVATVDLCPVTSRARLSYRRAAEIFEHATRPLADPVDRTQGFTLHQLRHAMLTHEAENGTNTATLLACSRHASIRAVEHYARPGPEAVTAHVAATDPAARRRTGQGR